MYAGKVHRELTLLQRLFAHCPSVMQEPGAVQITLGVGDLRLGCPETGTPLSHLFFTEPAPQLRKSGPGRRELGHELGAAGVEF